MHIAQIVFLTPETAGLLGVLTIVNSSMQDETTGLDLCAPHGCALLTSFTSLKKREVMLLDLMQDLRQVSCTLK